ncbi:MAG: acyltransferase [Clostridiales bacterium]|nr:acyltransferase [Clostridiales bacterium]
MKRAYAPSPRRIPELDGLRVLLVFIVAWYHFWQQSWLTPGVSSYSLDFLVRSGYMPVDGTILLSGFLLFLPYARAMLMDEPVPDRRWFYRRRIMRIVPSFYFVTLVMLLAVALPWGLYRTPQQMVKDVFMHFTFTFTFDPYTYISTPIGVASWTLAIEMQAYLLFPFIARWAMRRPAATMLGMTALAWLWRGWCLWAFADLNMVVNQLPSFLDVYALGMAFALLYVKLTQLWQKVKRPILWELLVTLTVAACVLALERLLKAQAYYNGNIQAGQMIHRFPLAVLLAVLAVSLPFTVLPLRKLMGNRVMTFLAGVSMNYYLIHQNLAVHLKRLGIPYSEYPLPNQAGDKPWQYRYTFLCFGLSLVLAVLATYLIEKPGARLLRRLFEKRDQRRKERYEPAAQAIAASVQDGETVILSNLSEEAASAVAEALGERPRVIVKEGSPVGMIDMTRK